MTTAIVNAIESIDNLFCDMFPPLRDARILASALRIVDVVESNF
jgi:hypothetical protein